MTMKPLPVKIPFEYADRLKVGESMISHVNAGRRMLKPLTALKLIRMARVIGDPRLKGLTFYHLRPDFAQYKPELQETEI